MRFLVTFVCLAVIATAIQAQPVEVEAEPQQLSAFEAQAADALLAADSATGHENESDRLARQYGRGYGGFGGGYRGGYGRGYGGFGGGYGRYGGYRGGYGGFGGFGGYRGGFYG